MKLPIVENLYDKLSPKLQGQISNDSDLKNAIEADDVPVELANLVDEIEDIEAILLYGDIESSNPSWGKLIKKYIKALDLDISKDVEAFLLARLSRESSVDIVEGNAPFLELLKNAKAKNIDLHIDVLDLIYDLYKSRDIIDYDLKLENSWLLNPNIYKNEKIDGQIYKIKLHVFLDDQNTVKNFKDANGKSLPEVLANWDSAVKDRSAKELQRLYAPYTSDAYEARQRKNKNKISLDAYVKLRIKESTENNNKQWTEKNWGNNLITAIKFSNHKNKDNLAKTLKDILVNDRKKFDSMKYNLDLRNDLQLLVDPKNSNINIEDRSEFANLLANYLTKEIDLSKNIKQNKLQPNTDYTVSDALRLSGSNPGEAYGFFRGKVVSYDSKRGGMTNYTTPLRKLFSKQKDVNQLLKSTIKSNRKGGFDWTAFIIRYLSNANFSDI